MSGLYPRRFRCSSSRGDCVQVLFIRLSPEGCGGRSCLTSFSLSWRRLPLLPVSLRHLSSAGVCLCVHTSHFHKDVGRIEEDPILQTLLNLITFVKILAQKKKNLCILKSGQQAIFSGGRGSHDSIYLPKNLPGMMCVRLKILLRGEHVGVSGGSASHFLWLPCVGEIDLETKPPTARTASSQEQRRKKQFCYWTSTEEGCTNVVRKLLRRLQRQKEMLLPVDK